MDVTNRCPLCVSVYVQSTALILSEFPYTHEDTSSQPFVCLYEKTFHVDEMIISNPTPYVLFQLTLSLGISPAIAATCQFF